MDTKQCCNCRQILPLEEFQKNRTTKDGLCAECRRCHYVSTNRFVSLHRRLRGCRDKTLEDTIAARKIEMDESYERVFKALGYWIQDGTLKKTQAEAIYLRAVELFTFDEIAETVECSRQSAIYHYQNGIARLRQRYDAEDFQSANAS